MTRLAFHTYGKTDVRLTQVTRHAERDDVLELSADILFEGDFDESYTAADNRRVLPTDTMKNTVYALARQKPIVSVEQFGCDLARHFLDRVPQIAKATIEILQTPWLRLHRDASAFVAGGSERRFASVVATRANVTIAAGVRDLEILKTRDSAFSDFLVDEWTTLPPTRDRLLGTQLDATWIYREPELNFNATHAAARQKMLDAFAAHRSESVQHTLHDMASALLSAFENVREVHMVMPNKHRLLVDLNKFGMDNPNLLFVPTDEPSGYIEARLTSER